MQGYDVPSMPAGREGGSAGTAAAADSVEPRPSVFAEGSIVDGKYSIEDTIAEGGLGVIVRATHLGLGQRVAIKYLKTRALADANVVERFEREARLAVQIASEHVVRVQDVGRLPGAGPYMVMEYLVGRDLGTILEEGPLPIVRAVDYVLQACDALAEAHALRIVHRDIKPENMFLAQRPSNTSILKIIDFGISKVAPRRGDGGKWARETGAEQRVGTPLYMSPEQLRSPADVDQRTDIWALGVVLFELITGAQVFDAVDMPELCASILAGSPKRLRDLIPDAPGALEAVILKCLEKAPKDRFRNVAELAQELLPFGPPTAASRIARIQQVVRRGGNSIRPATPGPMTVQRVPIAVDVTPAAQVEPQHVVAAPLPSRPPFSRRVGIAALAALAIAGLVAVVLLTRTSRVMPDLATAAPVAPIVAPVVSTTAPTLPPPEPTVAASASAAASDAAPRAAPVPPRRIGAPATPAAGTASPGPAPSSVRRVLFGERK